MNPKDQLDSLKALGKLEAIRQDIDLLVRVVDAAPLWRRGIALKKQIAHVLEIIDRLEQRFDRKLVVTLIGPTGSGKSTLLNALAGVDNLSESGHARPTTRGIVVLSRDKLDSRQLVDELGQVNVRLRSSHKAVSLEHVLLIDTPDTDSTEQEKHLPIVRKAIALSDILVCLFDAENPKRRDYVDFLQPFVGLFKGDALLVVLNKCDRLDETELKEVIVPEFEGFLESAWDQPVHGVFCISARSNLQEPRWDGDATPRHGFDQFAELSEIIFGHFNQPGYAVDRRLEYAGDLRDFLFSEVRRRIGEDLSGLVSVRESMRDIDREAVENAVESLRFFDTRQVLGVNVRLYQRLTQRWVGPIGWIVALWTRMLIFGAGLAAVFRFGNPVRQAIGLVSALIRMKETHSAVRELEEGAQTQEALENYRKILLQRWPDIAETLVSAGFDPSLRNPEHLLPQRDQFNDRLSELWQQSLELAVEDAAKTLSGPLLQLAFNLPTVGLLVHAGWITGRSYLSGNYLSSDFFLHAVLTILSAAVISFVALQVVIRIFAGPDRLIHRCFNRLKNRVETLQTATADPVSCQIDTLVGFIGRT